MNSPRAAHVALEGELAFAMVLYDIAVDAEVCRAAA